MRRPLSATRDGNEIFVRGDLGIQDVRRVLAVLNATALAKNHHQIKLNFSGCTLAFSGAMLPICARVLYLQSSGFEFFLEPPEDARLHKLFQNANWAHLIAPDDYEPGTRGLLGRQFPATRYQTHEDQERQLNELLECLLAVIPNFNRSAFAAVEWALNEITDNVINHSESPIGGLLQLSVFDLRTSRVEFTVSDAGVGVPSTLRTTRSGMKTDADALLQSVRSGVTRNAELFQGNGLYGSLEICRVGGGRFSLNSGSGALFSINKAVEARNELIDHCGTTVDAIIDFSEPQLLERALAIDGRVHKPVDYIELKYEQDGLQAVPFKLDEQATSFRSRPAGKPVHNKLANLVAACAGQTIYVDFGGITVVSSSFADEVFGKLFVALGPMRFMQAIRLVNVSPTVQALIDRAITQRMLSSGVASDVPLDDAT